MANPKQEEIIINIGITKSTFNDKVFIAFIKLSSTDNKHQFKIGGLGSDNKKVSLGVGDFVRYETSDKSIYEIRCLTIEAYYKKATILITQLENFSIFSKINENQPYYIESGSIDDNKFSSAEIKNIQNKLSELEVHLMQFANTEKEKLLLHSKINYLIDAVKRQSKSDWVNTSIGVFITLAIGLGISAANNDSFWQIIKNIFGNVVLLITS